MLELTIVVILVVMLFLVAADRLLPLRGDAESVQVATVIGGLRSALGIEVASRIVEEGFASARELRASNPMELLQDWPENYVGEYSGTGSEPVPEGAWYFHQASGELRYRVRFPQYLEGEPGGPVILRWQVQLQFDDRNDDGAFDPERESLHGVRLVRLDDHAWPGEVSMRAREALAGGQ